MSKNPGKTFDEYIDAAIVATDAAGVNVDAESIAYECSAGIIPSIRTADGWMVRHEEAARLGASVLSINPEDTLFDHLRDLFDVRAGFPTDSHLDSLNPQGTVFLRVLPNVAVSFLPSEASPELLQLLIPALRRHLSGGNVSPVQLSMLDTFSERELDTRSGGSITRVPLGRGVTVWSNRHLPASMIQVIWERCVSKEAAASDLDVLTMPKLYGNKHRLTGSIAAVARSYIGDGGTILDLMCGSGIVASRLSPYFSVWANDGNEYATLLTRAHFTAVGAVTLLAALQEIKVSFDHNYAALASILGDDLLEEDRFLHADLTAATWPEYVDFCDRVPFHSSQLRHLADDRRQARNMFPFCLTVAYFSNAYFGIHQSIQVDSIRYAIYRLDDERMRTFFLAALIVACCNCASTPHFAQPPKLNNLRATREVMEHRARDIYSEFVMTARFMQSRPPINDRLVGVSTGDWRQALEQFGQGTSGIPSMSKGVYVDPPYTKLQFSRYYHLLNTLLRYDYPGVSGQGRYPPRATRFSSRFEYQPTSAEHEFRELISRLASSELTTLISYSDRGFVRPDVIVGHMEKAFPAVHVYSKQFRHNSQGRPLIGGRQQVVEYIFAGVFP
jgi:adenine-specific DNA methylase